MIWKLLLVLLVFSSSFFLFLFSYHKHLLYLKEFITFINLLHLKPIEQFTQSYSLILFIFDLWLSKPSKRWEKNINEQLLVLEILISLDVIKNKTFR